MKIMLVWLCHEESVDQIEQLISLTHSFFNNIEINLLLLGATEEKSEIAKKLAGVNKIYIQIFHSNIFYSEEMLSVLMDFHENNSFKYYFFSGSLAGRELAPRFSYKIKGITAIQVESASYSNKKLTVTRGSFGQNLKSVYESDFTPVVLSFSRAIPVVKKECENENPPEIITLPKRKKYKGYEKSTKVFKKETDKIFASDTVFVAGRGVGREAFSKLKSLADELDVPLGSTRPVILSGLSPTTRMIGQSGIIIAPKTVVTFGVSGSAAFMIGILGAKKIIAINNDENAPIFSVADFGILADAEDIITRILARLN